MAADKLSIVPAWTRTPWAITIILVAAIATRAVTFGNPLVDMDDQFYWLVGRSWWDGSWPIVDIWDRKPVGLFLLYAAIAGISRSILAVQIAALLFAAGTALLIRAAALHIAGPRASLLAALTYLLFLPSFWGQSGQSPIFYNLFMAASALLLLKGSAANDPHFIRRHAFPAMFLSGIALVMKQVSIAEGVYFGLAFLYLLRRSGEPASRIVRTAGIMIAIALLPTILGASLFFIRGDGAVAAYLHASYFSIFAKTSGSGESLFNGVAYLGIFGGPLLVAAAIGLASRPASDSSALAYRLVAGWVAAAVVGYLLVPNFFPHYALPLFVPLSVMAARAFDRPIGIPLFVAGLVASLLTGRLSDWDANRRAAHDFEQLAATVRQAAGPSGCLYVANGPVGLYTIVPDCGVTHYVFPYHLTLATEATAVGISQAEEIDRIFAAAPAVVLTQDNRSNKQTPEVRALLARHLRADYRPIASFPRTATDELSTVRVWQRKHVARRTS